MNQIPVMYPFPIIHPIPIINPIPFINPIQIINPTPSMNPIIPDPSYPVGFDILERMIPIFDGDIHELDFFLQATESAIKISHPNQMPFLFQFIKNKIRGSAFEAIKWKTFNYWEDLKKFLIKKYKKPKSLFEYEDELITAKQNLNEQVEEYSDRIRMLVEDIKSNVKSDSSLSSFEQQAILKRYYILARKSFIHGLHSDLRILVRIQHPENFETAIQLALAEEKENENKVTVDRCQLCNESSHIAKYCSEYLKLTEFQIQEPCQLCGQGNHVAKECNISLQRKKLAKPSISLEGPNKIKNHNSSLSDYLELQKPKRSMSISSKFPNSSLPTLSNTTGRIYGLQSNSEITDPKSSYANAVQSKIKGPKVQIHKDSEEDPKILTNPSLTSMLLSNSIIHSNSRENPNIDLVPNSEITSSSCKTSEKNPESIPIQIPKIQKFRKTQGKFDEETRSNKLSDPNVDVIPNSKVISSSYENSEKTPEPNPIQEFQESKNSKKASGKFNGNSRSGKLSELSQSSLESKNPIQFEVPLQNLNSIPISLQNPNSYENSANDPKPNLIQISNNSKMVSGFEENSKSSESFKNLNPNSGSSFKFPPINPILNFRNPIPFNKNPIQSFVDLNSTNFNDRFQNPLRTLITNSKNLVLCKIPHSSNPEAKAIMNFKTAQKIQEENKPVISLRKKFENSLKNLKVINGNVPVNERNKNQQKGQVQRVLRFQRISIIMPSKGIVVAPARTAIMIEFIIPEFDNKVWDPGEITSTVICVLVIFLFLQNFLLNLNKALIAKWLSKFIEKNIGDHKSLIFLHTVVKKFLLVKGKCSVKKKCKNEKM